MVDIYYVEFLDHAFTTEEIEDIERKPYTLFTVGYIYQETDLYLIIVSTGSKYRDKKPSGKEVILKLGIIEKKIIYTINKN